MFLVHRPIHHSSSNRRVFISAQYYYQIDIHCEILRNQFNTKRNKTATVFSHLHNFPFLRHLRRRNRLCTRAPGKEEKRPTVLPTLHGDAWIFLNTAQWQQRFGPQPSALARQCTAT
jgi:hypothetical protein